MIHYACSSCFFFTSNDYRPRDGLKFLADTESQWQPRASLVTHVWWHKALFHFQLGQYEQAISLFDDVIMPAVKKGKCTAFRVFLGSGSLFSFQEPGSFPLSDATSLLLRLQMEPVVTGIDFKDRWREVANLYQSIIDDTATMHLFYDFHALLGCLYGNDMSSANKLLDSLATFSRQSDKYPDNFNLKNVSKYGYKLCQGLKAFAQCSYEEAYQLLKPLRHDWLQCMSGSRAQVDILNQVLIQAAIQSGNRLAAKKFIQERLAGCPFSNTEDNLLTQRLNAKIAAMI